jgi:hypothetical protein
MKRITFALLGILGMTAVTAIEAYPFTSDGVLFNEEYKTTGTQLDNCMTCHRGKSAKKNAYGSDYKKAGYTFEAIEESDSDGDGFSNIEEIGAGTFPGDPKSRPTGAKDVTSRQTKHDPAAQDQD